MKIEKVYSELGSMIQFARKQKHLTQFDLAKAVKLSRVSIANIEAGRQRLPFHLAVILSDLLDIDLNLTHVSVERAQILLSVAKRKRKQKKVKKLQKIIEHAQEALSALDEQSPSTTKTEQEK